MAGFVEHTIPDTPLNSELDDFGVTAPDVQEETPLESQEGVADSRQKEELDRLMQRVSKPFLVACGRDKCACVRGVWLCWCVHRNQAGGGRVFIKV